MKELTAEEKAKVYDEIVDRAKKELDACGSQDCDAAKQIFRLFPELKESERIRKALITFFQRFPYENINVAGTNVKEAIAWLEKQGEQEPDDKSEIKPKFKAGDRVIGVVSGMPYLITGVCDDYYNTESGCIIMFYAQDNFELYEQNPANKVEQKFKVGDYVVGKYISGYITEVRDDCYLLDYQGFPIDKQDDYRLWTIQDAKEGDTLVASDKSLFIYDGSINENGSVGFHIALTEDMDIILNSDDGCGWEEKDSCHLATKGQRILLFQKMKEAGYEWDTVRKKLKKIEQKKEDNSELTPFEVELFSMMSEAWQGYLLGEEVNITKIVKEHSSELLERANEQKPAVWSEKDETIANALTKAANDNVLYGYVGKSKLLEWLKSLKYRVQPQQEWSNWDKTMIESIDALCDEKIESVVFQDVKEHVNDIKDWIKSLKYKVVPQPKQEWSEGDEIEKAKKWFEKQNEWFDPNGNRHCDMESFEDFKKYMEGE